VFTITRKEHSSLDPVTKFVLDDAVFGKNEVSVLRKDTKDVIVLPTQTNCVMGCTFCHLTGTTRPAKNLSAHWFAEVVSFILTEEALGQRDLLVSFMGAGEPLLNISAVIGGMEMIHSEFDHARFAISTMMPNTVMFEALKQWVIASKISVKVHLSVHGILNRDAVVHSRIPIATAIEALQDYNETTEQPVEYHYTLVRDVNDSTTDLLAFRSLISASLTPNTTVKFLTLSECSGCETTQVSRERLEYLFNGITVEFYDPPGRDVGSSCGMFDRSIYMEP
jgi:adenine C2-methylase RlmN of 23S rRNA A2503 and tRNA A37